MIDPEYGYDPHQGCEQFYDCSYDKDKTAPITRWLRDVTNMDLADFRLSCGHIIRALEPSVVFDVYPDAVQLPDA